MQSEGISDLRTVLTTSHEIPKYQRNYTWTCKQAMDLWTDLTEYHCNKKYDSTYIFGQIVVYKCPDNKTSYIIDGQQRLTTTYIYLAALRSLIKQIRSGSSTYMSFLENLLYNYSNRGSVKPFLTVAKENRDYFEKLISGNYFPGDGNNSSQNNMGEIYKFFCRCFSLYLLDLPEDFNGEFDLKTIDPEEAEEKLSLLTQDLLDFKVVYLITRRLEDAHRIFDTVNTRGVKLSNTDLVKNHLFSTCYENDSALLNDDYSLEDTWNSISNSLGNSFETLFRYTMIVRSGIIRDDSIMRAVKISITGPDKVRNLVNDLTFAAKIFLCITKKVSFFQNESTNRILHGLYESKNHTIHTPLIISAYLRAIQDRRDIEDDVYKTVSAIDSLFVRNIYAGHSRSNDFEEKISQWASDYYLKVINFNKFLNSIYKECNNNEQFSRDIQFKNDWENKTAKYILSEIYNRSFTTISMKKKGVDLEHILPQKLDQKYWNNFDENTKKEYYRRIGNLIILKKAINRKIKNREFSFKKEKYESEEYGILDIETDSVLKVTVWNTEAIDNRSKIIAKEMATLWPVLHYSDNDGTT